MNSTITIGTSIESARLARAKLAYSVRRVELDGPLHLLSCRGGQSSPASLRSSP